MNMNAQQKKIFLFVLPFILLITASAVFYYSPEFLEKKQAYFCGFLFYWLFWCIAIPFLLLGKKSFAGIFKIQQPVLGKHSMRNLIFLIVPLAFVYSYEFPKIIKQADTIIIIASFALALINATAEEILWRGTYLKILGKDSKAYILFSSFGFAIWHFAPQIIYSNQQPGGTVSFVAFAFVLGLLFSSVVKNTGSIFLTVITHTLFDFGGLGARLYFK